MRESRGRAIWSMVCGVRDGKARVSIGQKRPKMGWSRQEGAATLPPSLQDFQARQNLCAVGVVGH